MTPTEQDEELLEKLDGLLKSPRYGVSLFAGHRDVLVEILANFITADRKRVALEARIDEVGRIIDRELGLDYGEETEKYLSVRIAELKAQQEEV